MTAVLAAACVTLLTGAAQAPAAGDRHFAVATTGNQRERVNTIAIQRHAKKSRRVVFSIGPHRLPDPRRGSTLEASGEVTLTTTCVDSSSRCIGRRYGFSPEIGMRIVLSGRPGATGGRRAVAVSRRIRAVCSQHRPNRNHHCPLVIEHSKLRIPKVTKLPCKPSHCRLNMVVDASAPKARHGDVVVVGADRPNGEIDHRKGRLNATLFARGSGRGNRRRSSDTVNGSIPLGSEGSGGQEVVFSVKVSHLHRGDALLARGRQLTDIGGFPFSAFVADQLIVATSRHATKPHGIARHAISFHGSLSAVNGFNCTQGPSSWQTPCLSRKVGLGRVQHNVVDKRGRDVPLFVNLVSRAFPKLASAPGGASAAVRGGFVEVRRLKR